MVSRKINLLSGTDIVVNNFCTLKLIYLKFCILLSLIFDSQLVDIYKLRSPKLALFLKAVVYCDLFSNSVYETTWTHSSANERFCRVWKTSCKSTTDIAIFAVIDLMHIYWTRSSCHGPRTLKKVQESASGSTKMHQ